MRKFPAVLLIAASLAGCGMKGALYMPPPKAATVNPATPPPEVPLTPDPLRTAPPQVAPAPK